jgi:hypothetical protein
MTTATSTAIRVPVRTWQEKAILAAAISSPLAGMWEGFDGHVGFCHDQLLNKDATDRLIDRYFGERPEITIIENLLRSLRAITLGPDAVLEVPTEFGLLEGLDDEIKDMSSLDVSELLPHVDHPDQREMAAATIVAIDYQQTIAALYDRDGGEA